MYCSITFYILFAAICFWEKVWKIHQKYAPRQANFEPNEHYSIHLLFFVPSYRRSKFDSIGNEIHIYRGHPVCTYVRACEKERQIKIEGNCGETHESYYFVVMEGKKKRERASGAAKERRFLLLNYSRGLLLVCYRSYVVIAFYGPTVKIPVDGEITSLPWNRRQRRWGQENWPIWNCCARECCERGKDDRM